MRTLRNWKLLFDEHCPLCRAYTKGFVNSGMLEAGGRVAYQQAQSLTVLPDMNRARNEIALINTETGEVYYGLESILKLIGHSYPWISKICRTKAAFYLLSKLYAFISYNRKVIAPSDAAYDSCVPDVKYRWRFAYLLFAWIITSLLLFKFSNQIGGTLPPDSMLREFVICGGQFIFQSGVLILVGSKRKADYLGNLATISLGGSILNALLSGCVLLLMSVGARNNIFSLSPLQRDWILIAVFMLVVLLMLREHIRRCRLLGVPVTLTFTWIMYRLIVLLILIKL